MSSIKRYDLFISYAHTDDRSGWVSNFVESLISEHVEFSGSDQALDVFFDRSDIMVMEDWNIRILEALNASSLMIAFISPNYFKSEFCRKEWEVWIDREKQKQRHGQSIMPIYFVEVPGHNERGIDQSYAGWVSNILGRRQYLDFRPWYTDGLEALRHNDVKQRIAALDDLITETLEKYRHASESCTNIPRLQGTFVGRNHELTRLREMLAACRMGAITAVHGLGGIGKSCLAFAYAHAYAHEYPGGRILVQCEGVSDLTRAFLQLVEPLGITASKEEIRDADLMFRRICHAMSQGGRILLLLDNLDSLDLLTPSSVSALPGDEHLHILTTTRLPPTQMPGMDWLPLDSLPERDGVRLLDRFRALSGESDRNLAETIVSTLDGFPLALEAVGVFLKNHPEVSLSDFLLRLKQEGGEAIASIASSEEANEIRHHEKLFSLIIEPTLRSLSEAERRALEFASVMPSDYICWPWLRSLAATVCPALDEPTKPGYPDPWITSKRKLEGLRLIVPGREKDLGRMHRFLGDYLRRQNPDTGAGILDELFAFLLNRRKVIGHDWADPEHQRDITIMALIAEEQQERNPPLCAKLSSAIGVPLIRLSLPVDIEHLLFGSIAVAHELGQSEGLLGLRLQYLLGEWLTRQGRYIEAKPYSKGSFELAVSLLGNSDRFTLDARNNYGFFLGHSKSATKQELEKFFRDSAAIANRTLAKNDLLRLEILTNLAWCLGNGQQDEQLALNREAYEAMKEGYSERHADLPISATNLAFSLWSKGNLGEAETLFREAIAILEDVFPQDHPELLLGYSQIGDFLFQNLRFDEAEDFFALVVQEMISGGGIRETQLFWASYKLGVIHLKQDRQADAERCLQVALESGLATEEIGLNELSQVVAAFQQLRVDSGKRDRVTRIIDSVLVANAFENAIKEDDSNADLHNQYAILLKNELRNFELCENHYRKALSIDTTNSLFLSNFALFLYSIRGKYSEAQDLFEKGLMIDSGNPSLLSNYGHFLSQIREEHQQAEELINKALSIDDTDSAILCNAGMLQLTNGDLQAARSYAYRAYSNRSDQHDQIFPRACFIGAAARTLQGREPGPYLGLLKQLLAEGIAHSPWRLDAFLKGFAECQKSEDHRFLTAILDATNTASNVTNLEKNKRWIAADEIPVDSPWPDIDETL